jgi:tetratricopeptide (TPR) repeat protein
MKRNLIIYLVLLLACLSPMQAQKAVSLKEQVIENKIRLNELEKKVDTQKTQSIADKKEIQDKAKNDKDELQVSSDKKVVDLEAKFELKKENLEYKNNWVNYLLAILGILITFFGIGVPIAAVYYGRKFSREIEGEKENAKAELEVFKTDFKDSLGQLIINSKERVQLLEEKAQVSIANLCKYEKDGKEISNGLNDLFKKATDPNSSDKDKKDSKLEAEKLSKIAVNGSYEKEMAETLELYFAKKYKIAIPRFLEIIKAYPKDINLESLCAIYFNIAYSYNNINKAGNLEKALEFYKKALEIKPDSHNAWYNLGCTYNDLKRNDDAIECYMKVLNITPNSAQTWNNIGFSYLRNKDYIKALENYKKALEIDDNYISAYENIVEVLLFTNQLKEAKEYLQKLEKITVKFEFGYFWIEMLYLKLIDNWNKNINETFDTLKESVKNERSKIEWEFNDIRTWLSSETSNFINKEQRTFISELVSLIEAWKLEDQKP